ncbi:MAG TPA: cell division protein ZipA C-terminal FtsZ-binding domain-containing protein [Steroidobacteraceae bacterium]|nr:cell division protein ZipA C-terminal FtsZ-binding domain-containing protein [Steroidobacteraceae bacterium]
MPELRWILLTAGVALILGLWWWETRKSRAKAAPAEPRTRERTEPTVDNPPVMDAGADAHAADGPVTSFTPTIERVRAPRRPPVVEIPDDLEVDVSAYVGKDRRRVPEPDVDVAPQEPPAADEIVDVGEAYPDEEQDDHQRAPWVRTQPMERPDVAPPKADELAEPEPMDPAARHADEASRQRIVALRLVAPIERWGGAQLREAFEAEGLRFGRFSVFHREREDGKTLFYVASMMEPGSFDLERMDQQTFPGISLFGIVPGAMEAPAVFDLILSTGRRLAERLGGQLQDEQGSTLTAQRILNLREDLVHFEHRHKRLRRY